MTRLLIHTLVRARLCVLLAPWRLCPCDEVKVTKITTIHRPDFIAPSCACPAPRLKPALALTGRPWRRARICRPTASRFATDYRNFASKQRVKCESDASPRPFEKVCRTAAAVYGLEAHLPFGNSLDRNRRLAQTRVNSLAASSQLSNIASVPDFLIEEHFSLHCSPANRRPARSWGSHEAAQRQLAHQRQQQLSDEYCARGGC